MIERNYFFKIESLQTLQKERRASGKVTCVTGFVFYRSFFSDTEKVALYVKQKVVSNERDFIESEIILTGLNRV